jgi:hypothetical protein
VHAIIFELKIQLGKKIQSELGKLRPSQSEILTKAFAEIDAGIPQAAFASIGLDYRILKQTSIRNSQRSIPANTCRLSTEWEVSSESTTTRKDVFCSSESETYREQFTF